MAVASADRRRIPGTIPGAAAIEGGRATRAGWVGGAFAVALHLSAGAAIIAVDPSRFHGETPIEIVIQEPPPPEVRPPPPEPPPPPPPDSRPRPVARRAEVVPPEATPPATPPPPSESAPPKAEEAPPIFGGTLSSVVAGGPSNVAIPAGNTLMTKPDQGARTGDVKPRGGDGTGSFAPVADIYIAKQPELLFAPDSPDEVYPAEAKRMGIEGVVRFKLGIDEKGNVVRVKITDKAGHGFDEAASRAVARARFKPAIGTDGRPVPCNIPYTYRFEIPE